MLDDEFCNIIFHEKQYHIYSNRQNVWSLRCYIVYETNKKKC